MDESTTELIVAQESQQAEISALEEACAEQEATIGLQEVIIRATSPQELMQLATDFFLGWLKCDAVGIRLRDGEDYPYYETKGFPESFVIARTASALPTPRAK